MHRVRNWSVTTCNPHCGNNLCEDGLFTFSVPHSFLFLISLFHFQFFFPSTLIFIHIFCVVLFYSFFTVFSLFPLSRQSAVSFIFCVSSHCICLSLSLSDASLSVPAAPNLLCRAYAPLKPSTQYPCCLALHKPLSEHDWVRRTEVTHSWAKSHFISALSAPCLLWNVPFLKKHAAGASNLGTECVRISGLLRSMHSSCSFVK